MANTILQPDARGLAEEHDAQPVIHHEPVNFSDRVISPKSPWRLTQSC